MSSQKNFRYKKIYHEIKEAVRSGESYSLLNTIYTGAEIAHRSDKEATYPFEEKLQELDLLVGGSIRKPTQNLQGNLTYCLAGLAAEIETETILLLEERTKKKYSIT